MTDKTPVSDYVAACVKALNEALQTTTPSTATHPQPMREGYEAVFELVDLPWDEHTEEDGLFREGYEICLLDIVNAIADSWGVELPKLEAE